MKIEILFRDRFFFFFGITEGNRYPRSVNGGGGFEQGGGFLMWME